MIDRGLLLATGNKLLYITIIILQNKDRLIPNFIPTLINDLNVDSAPYVTWHKRKYLSPSFNV